MQKCTHSHDLVTGAGDRAGDLRKKKALHGREQKDLNTFHRS